MKVLLNVPFDEKDDAKFLATKWDKEVKSWYIEDIRTLMNSHNGQGILSAKIYIS